MLYVIILFILILTYSFYTGLNNGSISIASAVATRVMKPNIAIYFASAINLITPIIMFFVADMAVAGTVQKDIVYNDYLISLSAKEGFIFIGCGLIAALIWGFSTQLLGIPNSISHMLMGGLIGSAIAVMSFSAIQWNNVLIKIALMAVLAPIVGMAAGYLLMLILKKILKYYTFTSRTTSKIMQLVNVTLLGSAISINAAQKNIGVLLLAFVCCSEVEFLQNNLYIAIILISITAALGILFSGHKIINTVGNRIYKLNPYLSYTSQLSAAIVIFAASAVGIPVSTGQVVSSAIMGVGSANRFQNVKWSMAGRIIVSWFLTLPANILLGFVLSKFILLIY